jgi:predicted metal-dependent phosphotriesterase family hydrolase
MDLGYAVSWWNKVTEFLRDEPIYAQRGMTDAGLAEGWKVAFEMERDKLRIAEKRLKALEGLGDAIIEYDMNPQYGRDIKALLTMTEDELDRDYGQD